MITKEVTAEVPERKKDGKVVQTQLGPVTVSVKYPENLKEAEEMFSADAILSNAFANWRVVLQGNIRSALKRGETPDDIVKRLATAVMGVASTGGKVDAEAAFKAKFMSASKKDRDAMINKLKELAASAA